MYTAEVQCDAETHAGRGGFLESLRQGPGPCMACPGGCGRQGRAVPWARPPPDFRVQKTQIFHSSKASIMYTKHETYPVHGPASASLGLKLLTGQGTCAVHRCCDGVCDGVSRELHAL